MAREPVEPLAGRHSGQLEHTNLVAGTCKRTGLAPHARVELDRLVQQHRDVHKPMVWARHGDCVKNG
jgi:hypothetical protein